MSFLLIMPSYNQSHYIGSAIDSVLAQTDPDWELWIVDNSTDDTPQVVARYTADKRIRFHHIPERMDPGTCLNWALERAQGRDFSYVHTDNNLAPNYVALMRKALSQDDLALAYCDMKVIDDKGHYTGVYRRREFDLARLISLSPLGVPFSATTALAKQIGGFSTRDVADDVLFSLLAYGRAKFVYISDAPMDYRLHQGSRTTDHGGAKKMTQSFLQSYLRALPDMLARQIDVLGALREKIETLRTGIELQVQDAWYRRGHLTGIELNAEPSLQIMWEIGHFKLPDLPARHAESLRPRHITDIKSSKLRLSSAVKFKLIQRKIRKQIQFEANQFRDYLVPWAVLSAGTLQSDTRCWLGSADVYTVWSAKMLQNLCGWQFFVTAEDRSKLPAWLDINVAPLPAQPTEKEYVMSISRNDMYVRKLSA